MNLASHNTAENQCPPRRTDRPLPAYAYVPRMHPHPVSDPKGHSYGDASRCIEPSHELSIQQHNDWAIDLFNNGFYWESHEVWEAIWVALGRVGTQADFVKGLIKLAAAGVKAREGNANGVQRHARRAAELFESYSQADNASHNQLLGMSSDWLRVQCRVVCTQPEKFTDATRCAVKRVFPFSLVPTCGLI